MLDQRQLLEKRKKKQILSAALPQIGGLFACNTIWNVPTRELTPGLPPNQMISRNWFYDIWRKVETKGALCRMKSSYDIRCHKPKGIGPNLVDNEKEEESTTAALCELLKQIGPSYLISHSYTGIIMFRWPSYLWQPGVSLDWILLAERSIRGNGHFSFLEKNNLEIAEKVVLPWLQLQSGPKGHKDKKPKAAGD
ncbi:MAG: hypothetical protein Q9221_006636 [Calogaya cf. arnoldii]